MRSINKAFIIGNLTRDPEMRQTAGNQYITTFGIATNREWVTTSGQKQQSTEFHDIVCFGRLAEIAHQYLKKGRLVNIEGYLKTRSWDDSSGVKRFRTEIVAEDLIMLEKRPQQDRREENLESVETAVETENLQPMISIEDPLTI